MLAAGTLLRFLVAGSTGLGVDESYAVAVARQLSLSYFDHPPLHFWIAGVMAKLAHSEASEVVRFPFVICFAATTWIMVPDDPRDSLAKMPAPSPVLLLEHLRGVQRDEAVGGYCRMVR